MTTEPDGMIWGYSEALGLDLCWRDKELLFRDPATGEFLLNQLQTQDALENAEARAREEHAARRDAETRLRELEAELRRHRGEE